MSSLAVNAWSSSLLIFSLTGRGGLLMGVQPDGSFPISWRKSRYSADQGNCVEIARLHDFSPDKRFASHLWPGSDDYTGSMGRIYPTYRRSPPLTALHSRYYMAYIPARLLWFSRPPARKIALGKLFRHRQLTDRGLSSSKIYSCPGLHLVMCGPGYAAARTSLECRPGRARTARMADRLCGASRARATGCLPAALVILLGACNHRVWNSRRHSHTEGVGPVRGQMSGSCTERDTPWQLTEGR